MPAQVYISHLGAPYKGLIIDNKGVTSVLECVAETMKVRSISLFFAVSRFTDSSIKYLLKYLSNCCVILNARLQANISRQICHAFGLMHVRAGSNSWLNEQEAERFPGPTVPFTHTVLHCRGTRKIPVYLVSLLYLRPLHQQC